MLKDGASSNAVEQIRCFGCHAESSVRIAVGLPLCGDMRARILFAFTDFEVSLPPPAVRIVSSSSASGFLRARRGLMAFLLCVGALSHFLQASQSAPHVFPWLVVPWPHGFHLWVVETVAWSTMVLLLILHRIEPSLRRWMGGATAAELACFVVATLLVVEGVLLLGFWLTRNMSVEQLGWVRAAFWLDAEWRLPALFSAAQLWLGSFLAWRCWQLSSQRAWMFAAIVLAYLGADEFLMLHERIGIAARSIGLLELDRYPVWQGVDGLKLYAWQLVFLPVVLVVGASLFMSFRRAVDNRSIAILCLSALIFLSGSMGFEARQAVNSEAVEGWGTTEAGHRNILFEEGLEMFGVTVAVGVIAYHFFRHCLRGRPEVRDTVTAA